MRKTTSCPFVSIVILMLMFSCSSMNPKDAALFYSFSYEGHDDFYMENPLPGDDYVYNPMIPGWYSDPSICTNGDGDYFLVTSTFAYYPGVPIFHSRDLVNWEQIGNVLSRPSQLLNLEHQSAGTGGIYAPDIKYNPANKTFYMITTNVGAGNFVVKTKDPWGAWSDPIPLPQVVGIDPSLFFDDDGRAYIVNNDDAPDNKPEYSGHRTIRVVEYDVATDKTIGERKIIVNKGVKPEDKPIWIEGPHMYKINGKYFLMCAEGGTEINHSEVIFRSDSPMGGFKPWSGNPILTQRQLPRGRRNAIACTGHADLVCTKEGQWWAVFLGTRPLEQGFENLGRETFMLPLRWSDDGFPFITSGNETVSMIVKHDGAKRSENVTFGNFSVEDQFDADSLGLQWMTLRGPATDLYSLKEYPGYLELKCSDHKSTDRTVPAAVFRRVQHHKFTAQTRMTFHPSDALESAGMLLFKDESHQYYMKVCRLDGAPRIVLEMRGRQPFTIATCNLPGNFKNIDLKVVSTGLTFEFWYSVGGKTWKLLKDQVDASFLSTAIAGGFTGTTIGLYAEK